MACCPCHIPSVPGGAWQQREEALHLRLLVETQVEARRSILMSCVPGEEVETSLACWEPRSLQEEPAFKINTELWWQLLRSGANKDY